MEWVRYLFIPIVSTPHQNRLVVEYINSSIYWYIFKKSSAQVMAFLGVSIWKNIFFLPTLVKAILFLCINSLGHIIQIFSFQIFWKTVWFVQYSERLTDETLIFLYFHGILWRIFEGAECRGLESYLGESVTLCLLKK